MALVTDVRGRNGSAGSLLVSAPSAGERLRAFQLARRHSSIVKTLRLVLPACALLLAAGYGFTLTSSWKLGAGRLSVGSITVTPDDLTMKNPSYFGVTKDGGRYEVRAKRAILEFNHQKPIKLIDVDGDLVQANDVVTKLKAKHGLLDNAKGELELYDGIQIDASNGLSARLSRATVYSKKHRIVSNDPVDVTMPAGSVRGSTMTMQTDTHETNFAGQVAVRLVQSGRSTAPTPGFGGDSRQPVDVTSDQLYINDSQRIALFTGSVVAVQGDSTLRTRELHVLYEGKATAQMAAASPQPADGSKLSRLIAKKGAIVTAGLDRRISSETADFDVKADTGLFTGDVVINQAKNVLRGRRLFIDRKSGKSRLESPAEGAPDAGRITATFFQTDNKSAAPPKPKSVGNEIGSSLQESIMGSFKTDPNAPIDIEANTLEVNDRVRQAIFRGNVNTKQGDFIMRTIELVAFYSGQSSLGLAAQTEDGSGRAPAQLTRVEAKQRVLVISKDGQTATGDWATFDVRANTVVMGGRVVVTRGKDVAEGPRLKIDLTTGMYRFELEGEPAVAHSAPATSASDPVGVSGASATGTAADPAGHACPPGKQCMLFYPKEAKDAAKKALPPDTQQKLKDAWRPSMSASPVQRSD